MKSSALHGSPLLALDLSLGNQNSQSDFNTNHNVNDE
jgi:hypothetical protein